MRKTIITGGGGFVGSALTRRILQNEDERVVVVDNFFNGRHRFLPTDKRLETVEIDLRDIAKVAEIFREFAPRRVFHLAALHFIPYCNEHPAEAVAVNNVGTQAVLDACAKVKPEIVVAASTVAVYPIRDDPNREDDIPGPSDIYGLTKLFNENQVELFARESGVRCAMARLSNVYGPRETNPHVIPEIYKQVLDGVDAIQLGNCKPKRDYIYVDDVAEGLTAISERFKGDFRVFNLGTNQEHSVEEIVAMLADISGRPLRIETDPARVRKSDRMHLLADISRIRDEIGWQPRYDLRTGLTELWEYENREAALQT